MKENPISNTEKRPNKTGLSSKWDEFLFEISRGVERFFKIIVQSGTIGFSKLFFWGSLWAVFFLPFEYLNEGFSLIFTIFKLAMFFWLIQYFFEKIESDEKKVLSTIATVICFLVFLLVVSHLENKSKELKPVLAIIREATFSRFSSSDLKRQASNSSDKDSIYFVYAKEGLKIEKEDLPMGRKFKVKLICSNGNHFLFQNVESEYWNQNQIFPKNGVHFLGTLNSAGSIEISSVYLPSGSENKLTGIILTSDGLVFKPKGKAS
jgi:hypothetical protein